MVKNWLGKRQQRYEAQPNLGKNCMTNFVQFKNQEVE